MLDLQLSQPQEFTVTVNKAHKILESLKKYESYKKSNLEVSSFAKSMHSSYQNLNSFEISYAMILTNNIVDIENIIKNEIDEKVYRYISAIEVLEDIQKVKECIFSFNVKSGISEKLNFISRKANLIKLYEAFNLKKRTESDLNDIVTRLKKLHENAFERNEDFSFEFQYWDNDAITKNLKEIKSTILQHEEQISKLNASEQITISLYESSIELLGL